MDGGDGEQRLIEAARRGDSEARDALYLRFEVPLRGYLRRQVGERLARAVSLSDLCQDTFLQALDAMRVLPDEATVDDFQGILYQHAQWLVGKQITKHRDFRGESALGRSGIAGAPANISRTSGDVTRLDEVDWLRGMVERLPDEQACVIRLRLENRSFAEIGEQLGIPEDTARKRFLRGSLALKRLCESR